MTGPLTVRGRGRRLGLVSDVMHGRAAVAEAFPPEPLPATPPVTVRGARALGRPFEHGRTDPAAVDECFLPATKWAREMFGGGAVPTGVREVRVRRTGLLSSPGKVVMSAGRVQDGWAECDLALADADGSARVELLGVALSRHPAETVRGATGEPFENPV